MTEFKIGDVAYKFNFDTEKLEKYYNDRIKAGLGVSVDISKEEDSLVVVEMIPNRKLIHSVRSRKPSAWLDGLADWLPDESNHSDTNHKCTCGQKMYIGIIGKDCPKCGRFNEAI